MSMRGSHSEQREGLLRGICWWTEGLTVRTVTFTVVRRLCLFILATRQKTDQPLEYSTDAVYNDSNWSVDQISYDSVKLGLEGVAYSNSVRLLASPFDS